MAQAWRCLVRTWALPSAVPAVASARGGWLSALPPALRRVVGGEARQLGAGLVQVGFGALSAGPQIVTGLCQCRGPGVQHGPQFLAFAFGIGAGLAELAGGFFAGPVSVGAQLREFTGGMVACLLGGADEGGSVGVSALDRLPRLGLGPGCLVTGGADLRAGLGPGLLDPGCGLTAGLFGVGARVGGALFGVLACGLGGLEFPVHFQRRAARFLGVGFGLLPALRFPGGLGLGVGYLLGGFGLHRLDLRGRRFGVGGPVQLRREVGQLAGQRGHVGADPVAQLSRPRGGHGDRPSQVLRLGLTARAGELLTAPERGQRGVRLPGQRVRPPAVLRFRPGPVIGGARLVLASGVLAGDGLFGLHFLSPPRCRSPILYRYRLICNVIE